MVSSDYVVKRDGKYMHRIRAQYYELSKEGEHQSLLAGRLRYIFVTGYIDTKENSQLLEMWNIFWNMYQRIAFRSQVFPTFPEFKEVMDHFFTLLREYLNGLVKLFNQRVF